jgi:hypothetical protein
MKSCSRNPWRSGGACIEDDVLLVEEPDQLRVVGLGVVRDVVAAARPLADDRVALEGGRADAAARTSVRNCE